MTETVAGIDYGTSRVSVAVLGQETAVLNVDLRKGTTKAAKAEVREPGDVLWPMYEAVHQFLGVYRPTLVAVERPLTGASGNALTAAEMAMVAGTMVLAARQVGAKVRLIAPSAWKKAICGHGSLDKNQVEAWLREHRPEFHARCHAQDDVDAFCLALAAQAPLA